MLNGIVKGYNDLKKGIKIITTTVNRPQVWVRLLTILIVESIVCIGFLALIHNPHLDFDEANTLRTATLDIFSIHQLVTNDQNFPLYYDWLHVFAQYVRSVELAALITNYAVWLLSCALFYKSLRLLIKNNIWVLLVTLMFIHTSSNTYYASYIRMYGCINLFLLCYFYSLLRYKKQPQLHWLLLLLLSLLGLVLLHPIAILILPPVILTLWRVVQNPKHQRITSGGILSCTIILLFQILTKTNPYQVYVTQGRSYLLRAHLSIFELPANLFFSLHNPIHDELTSIFFVIFLVCAYIAVKQKIWNNSQTFSFSIFCLEFLSINVLFPTQLSVHHLTFFAIPCLVVFAIIATKIPQQRALLLLSAILLCAIPLTIKNYRAILITASSVNKFCQGIQAAHGTTIITDYATFDAVSYCLGEKKADIILLLKNELFFTQQQSFQQILQVQANAYGQPPLILERSDTIGKTLLPLKHILSQKSVPERLTYIKITYDDPYLFPDEIKTFSAYALTSYTYPGVFKFKKHVSP